MDDTLETPRKKRAGDKRKITLYFDSDVGQLYDLGGRNGWDVCAILRKGGSDAIRARADILVQPAENFGQEAG